MSPDVALGASNLVSEGLRRSPSTRIAREPPWAINWASDAAIVDLPSFGNVEVTPITLFGLRASSKPLANLMERIASVKREKGESTTCPASVPLHSSVLEANLVADFCLLGQSRRSRQRGHHGNALRVQSRLDLRACSESPVQIFAQLREP